MIILRIVFSQFHWTLRNTQTVLSGYIKDDNIIRPEYKSECAKFSQYRKTTYMIEEDIFWLSTDFTFGIYCALCLDNLSGL